MMHVGSCANNLLGLALCLMTAVSSAQKSEAYPSRPVRMIVQFAPGGNNDTVARALARQLTEQFGRQFVVDNRPGAGGAIGVQLVASAAPDGYTLGIGFIGNLAINPHLTDKLPYDPIEDFTAISRVADAPNLLAVHPSLTVKSVAELVAHAKANPQKIAYASGGIGTINHMAGELLAARAGIRLLHVPFKGSGQAVSDAIGGNVPMIFGGPPTLAPHTRSGKLRALAITTLKRVPAFADIPTLAESGYPGFQAVAWIGIVGPAGMPTTTIERLNQGIREALNAQEVIRMMDANGFEITNSTPASFAQFIKTEHAAWGKLIRETGIRGQQI